MKKFISLCLIIVLSVTAFSSCKANKTAEVDLSKYADSKNPIAVIEMKDGVLLLLNFM